MRWLLYDVMKLYIIMFLTNLHAFGKYYYDTWRAQEMVIIHLLFIENITDV